MLAEEVTISTIQFVFEAMENGNLPNLGVVDQFTQSIIDISFGSKLPHNATARRCVTLKEPPSDDDTQISSDTGKVTNIDESQVNNANDYDDNYIDDVEADEARLIYGPNNTTNEIPMQQDLNYNNTAKSFILYYRLLWPE